MIRNNYGTRAGLELAENQRIYIKQNIVVVEIRLGTAGTIIENLNANSKCGEGSKDIIHCVLETCG